MWLGGLNKDSVEEYEGKVKFCLEGFLSLRAGFIGDGLCCQEVLREAVRVRIE
jgi:hypothetical protein